MRFDKVRDGDPILPGVSTTHNLLDAEKISMALFQLVLVGLIASVLCEEYVKVVLGDRFTLPVNCKSDEEGALRKEESPTRQIATHLRGVWIPERSFRNRINQSSSVVFNRAVYTDSGGYVLECGGRVVGIQVEVVVSSDASVKEGEAVSLPCYYSTTVGICWSVRWAKGRDDVLKWNSCTVTSNWAASRLSLSADWLSHGNLSLNLQQAGKNDEGDYFCYVQARGGLEQKGNPAAVRLKVSERSPDQITGTSPPPPTVSPTQKPCEAAGLGTPAAVSIIAVVCLIISAAVGWLLKSFSPKCASCRPSEVLEPLSPHQYTNGFPPPSDTDAVSAV